jgi:hypothetical protein
MAGLMNSLYMEMPEWEIITRRMKVNIIKKTKINFSIINQLTKKVTLLYLKKKS